MCIASYLKNYPKALYNIKYQIKVAKHKTVTPMYIYNNDKIK